MSKALVFPDEGIGLGIELTALEYNNIGRLEREQEVLQQKIRSTLQVSPEFNEALSCRSIKGLQELIDIWPQSAERSQALFGKKHERGWGRWSKKYQSVSAGVCDFMRDISPLLHAVSEIGGPFTGVAIGTISAVFFLAGKKYELEEEIARALEDIKDRLPGFRMYADIYNKNHELEVDLRKKIIASYLAFIELCIAIIQYYLQSGWRRWRTATFTPSTLRVLSDNATKAVLAVRHKCEELVNWNIVQARKDMAQALQDNQRLEKKIDELTNASNAGLMLRFKALLNLSIWTLQGHQKIFLEHKELAGFEMIDEERYEQMTTKRIEHFRKTPSFLSWDAKGESKLLLLTGENHDNFLYYKQNCWVSPFAFNIIDRACSNPTTTYHASFIFASTSCRESPITMYDALSVILLQLITSRRGAISRSQQTLDDALLAFKEAKVKDGTMDELTLVAKLRELVFVVLELFDIQDTVYIVLDRIDRCRESDHGELLDLLVELVGGGGGKCVVKVLAVAKRSDWEQRVHRRYRGRVEEANLIQRFIDEDEYY